jgi:glycerol kinase
MSKLPSPKEKKQFIGAVDQGTTSSRFLIFDDEGNLITYHQVELPQSQPHPGYAQVYHLLKYYY